MSKELIELIGKVAELPAEKQKEFLIFGQGLVAGMEIGDAKTAAAGTEDGSSLIRPSGTFPQGKAEDGGAA